MTPRNYIETRNSIPRVPSVENQRVDYDSKAQTEEVPIENRREEEDDSLCANPIVPRRNDISEPTRASSSPPEDPPGLVWVLETDVTAVVQHHPRHNHDDPGIIDPLLGGVRRITLDGIWAKRRLFCVVAAFAFTFVALNLSLLRLMGVHYLPRRSPAKSAWTPSHSPAGHLDLRRRSSGVVTTTIRSDHHSQKCADITSFYDRNETTHQQQELILWYCRAGQDQKFRFEPVHQTKYRIKVLATQLCLQIVNGSIDVEAFVVQGECDDELHQLWTVTGLGGYQRIRVAHTGMCLDVQGARREKGANLVQWPCREGTPWTSDFWRADDRLSSQET